jgi:K+-transporting ATPase ATPase C chain
MLVAQPFTKDEYFQPRPSAASFDASASASSAYAPSNYALRDRVARVIGPIATYAAGDKKGQLVAPDVEAWFKADKSGGNPHIVAQWADAHNSIAQAWVTGDPTHALMSMNGRRAMTAWSRTGSRRIRRPRNLRRPILRCCSSRPSQTTIRHVPLVGNQDGADGKAATGIEPVSAGSDIQSIFFDMWRADHADVALNDVPGDLVTASASGLDPDITLANAEFQLDRVAAKWADYKKLKADDVRKDIEALLQQKAYAPWGGAIGETLVNVLDVNLELHKRYGDPA